MSEDGRADANFSLKTGEAASTICKSGRGAAY